MARPKATLVYNVYSADCPTRTVLDIVADKWTSLVIVALVPGTTRFQQLKREIDGITQKMLTQTLRSLERKGWWSVARIPRCHRGWSTRSRASGTP